MAASGPSGPSGLSGLSVLHRYLIDIINTTVHTDWRTLLLTPRAELEGLELFLATESTEVVYPAPERIFYAFTLFNITFCKVVIIGADPYHGTDQAMGLAFSIAPDTAALPPSLRNIFKEIESDTGVAPADISGDLTGWAQQGVLLLNTALTVRAHKAGSHARAWKAYTDALIALISEHSPHPLVFILWGNLAKSKKALIEPRHHIITGVHPSPLSAYGGFFGSRPFSACNALLTDMGNAPIVW